MPSPRLADDLLAVLAQLDSPAAIGDVLEDLLTPAETEAVDERWSIVKLLDEGHSQRAVRDALGCSVTTVSRGARALRYGSGGFRRALDLHATLPRPMDATEPAR